MNSYSTFYALFKSTCSESHVSSSVGVTILVALGILILLQVGLNKLQRILTRDYINAADAVAMRYTVDLVRLVNDLQGKRNCWRYFL